MSRHTLTQSQFDMLESWYGEDVRADYSGRGMYGKQVLAYTGDQPTRFAVELVGILFTEDDADYTPTHQDVLDWLDDLGEPRSDGMGLGTVYYWTNVQVEGHDGSTNS